MKLTTAFLAVSLSLPAMAQEISIKDYQWTMTDIASVGLKKEELFTKMDREFVNTKSSICSNRAHMWAADFKTQYNIDTGKIFLFFVKPEKTKVMKTVWWYHVAPIVNEKGQEFVLDAGFSYITGPMTKDQWFQKFARSTNCKEINSNETELLELIFPGRPFPRETSYGNYDCYYKITPHTFWTPRTVVGNILGRNEKGRPVRIERPEIDANELYLACIEATSTKFGYALGASKKKCEEYVANSRL